MNEIFYQQKRLLGLMATSLMIFFLARFLIVMGIPTYSMHTPTHWKAPLPAQVPVHQQAATPELVIVHPQAQAQVAARQLSLQSSLSSYHYALTGRVLCGTKPCAADLHVFLETDHNEDIERVFSTDAAGHFQCNLDFKERIRKPMDWRVTVYAPHSFPIELHGRQILTDESDIEVDKTILLP